MLLQSVIKKNWRSLLSRGDALAFGTALRYIFPLT